MDGEKPPTDGNVFLQALQLGFSSSATYSHMDFFSNEPFWKLKDLCIPSWELTYPSPRQFWRWVSFSPFVGYVSVPWRVNAYFNWVIKHLYLGKWIPMEMGGKTNHHLPPSPKNWGFWIVGFDAWSVCFLLVDIKTTITGPQSHQLYKWRFLAPLRVWYKTAANAHLFKTSYRGNKKS